MPQLSQSRCDECNGPCKGVGRCPSVSSIRASAYSKEGKSGRGLTFLTLAPESYSLVPLWTVSIPDRGGKRFPDVPQAQRCAVNSSEEAIAA
jgi:hypothetical protein